MQIGKAGAVAVGALTAVAAMGSAATAAPAVPSAKASATPTTAIKLDRSPLGQQDLLGLGGNKKQPLLTVGVHSNITAAPWQVCGSTAVAGVGGAVSAGTPHTVIGDCKNANTQLHQTSTPGLISILDDSSVNAADWQVCGSTAVAGVGVAAAVNSPQTVTGTCKNSNQIIKGPDSVGPNSLLSVLSGSVVNVAPWQVCGSSAVAGLGAVAALNSPTTVLGDCVNATVTMTPRANPAVIPILGNTDLTLLPWQWCGENSPISLVGLVIPVNSPALVGGQCITHP